MRPDARGALFQRQLRIGADVLPLLSGAIPLQHRADSACLRRCHNRSGPGNPPHTEVSKDDILTLIPQGRSCLADPCVEAGDNRGRIEGQELFHTPAKMILLAAIEGWTMGCDPPPPRLLVRASLPPVFPLFVEVPRQILVMLFPVSAPTVI